jgi:hypothetical protein
LKISGVVARAGWAMTGRLSATAQSKTAIAVVMKALNMTQ